MYIIDTEGGDGELLVPCFNTDYVKFFRLLFSVQVLCKRTSSIDHTAPVPHVLDVEIRRGMFFIKFKNSDFAMAAIFYSHLSQGSVMEFFRIWLKKLLCWMTLISGK